LSRRCMTSQSWRARILRRIRKKRSPRYNSTCRFLGTSPITPGKRRLCVWLRRCPFSTHFFASNQRAFSSPRKYIRPGLTKIPSKSKSSPLPSKNSCPATGGRIASPKLSSPKILFLQNDIHWPGYKGWPCFCARHQPRIAMPFDHQCGGRWRHDKNLSLIRPRLAFIFACKKNKYISPPTGLLPHPHIPISSKFGKSRRRHPAQLRFLQCRQHPFVVILPIIRAARNNAISSGPSYGFGPPFHFSGRPDDPRAIRSRESGPLAQRFPRSRGPRS